MENYFSLYIIFENHISNKKFPQIIKKKLSREFFVLGKSFPREQFSTKNFHHEIFVQNLLMGNYFWHDIVFENNLSSYKFPQKQKKI